MLCILYVIAVGTFLSLAGTLVEHVLPPTWPRRWMWCAVFAISVVLPGVYRYHHAWTVTEGHAGHALASASPAAADDGVWRRIEAYDRTISRLWLTTSAFLLLYSLANAARVWRVIRRSRNRRGDSTVDGVRVVVTDSMGPATAGVWRARIVLPRWALALPAEQRQYVVRHEEEHRKAHDALLLFAGSLLAALVPWNLALWWQLRRLSLAVEMDCDHRVVTALGDAPAYGELLLRVAEVGSRGPRLQPALLGGSGMLERRLTFLLEPARVRRLQQFLLPALALALLYLVVVMPHPVLAPRSGAHVVMVQR